MIALILICHGDLASAMLGAAERIVGPQDGITAVSNDGKAPEVFREDIRQTIESAGSEGVLIMADLLGSSCWRAGLETLRDAPTPVAVVSGLNLGMLLSFTQKRATLSFSELAEMLANDGKRAINGPRFSSDAG